MDYSSAAQSRYRQTDTFCRITDNLVLARKLFPGKRNSLTRYATLSDNNSKTCTARCWTRSLADVYLP
jgi:DNA polymerase-3 subunit epsilon